MSRRKTNTKFFPPVKVATFRKELVAYYEKTMTLCDRALAEGVMGSLMDGLPADSLEHARNEVAAARAAELFWVSDEIARQALDASQDVPHISPADAPSTSGVLFFEKPLAPLLMDQLTRAAYLEHLELIAAKVGIEATENITSQVQGVMWAYLGRGQLALTAFGVHGAKSSGPGDIDPRLPLGYFDLPLGQITEIGEITQSEGQQAFLAFLSALWVLIKTPTVAQVSEGDIATGATTPRRVQAAEEAPAPFTVPDKRRVQVVDMVPMRHAHEQEDPEATDNGARRHRKSPYKWVVRGHWRNQRVGKGREDRRLTWVASYLKGNPDGPLKNSEKIYTWRAPQATQKKEN